MSLKKKSSESHSDRGILSVVSSAVQDSSSRIPNKKEKVLKKKRAEQHQETLGIPARGPSGSPWPDCARGKRKRTKELGIDLESNAKKNNNVSGDDDDDDALDTDSEGETESVASTPMQDVIGDDDNNALDADSTGGMEYVVSTPTQDVSDDDDTLDTDHEGEMESVPSTPPQEEKGSCNRSSPSSSTSGGVSTPSRRVRPRPRSLDFSPDLDESVQHVSFTTPSPVLVTLDEDPIPFKCTICGKKLASAGKLDHHRERKHLLINIAERPFRCSQCPKGFSDKRKLRAHKRKAHY